MDHEINEGDWNHEQLSQWEGESEYSSDHTNIKLKAQRSTQKKLVESVYSSKSQEEKEKKNMKKKSELFLSIKKINSCSDRVNEENRDKLQSEKNGSLVRLESPDKLSKKQKSVIKGMKS